MTIAVPVLDRLENDAIASQINLPIVARVLASGAISVAGVGAQVFITSKDRGGKTPRISVRLSIAA